VRGFALIQSRRSRVSAALTVTAIPTSL
jgi:hypothetical protein